MEHHKSDTTLANTLFWSIDDTGQVSLSTIVPLPQLEIAIY
jgi:hypothetical protein